MLLLLEECPLCLQWLAHRVIELVLVCVTCWNAGRCRHGLRRQCVRPSFCRVGGRASPPVPRAPGPPRGPAQRRERMRGSFVKPLSMLGAWRCGEVRSICRPLVWNPGHPTPAEAPQPSHRQGPGAPGNTSPAAVQGASSMPGPLVLSGRRSLLCACGAPFPTGREDTPLCLSLAFSPRGCGVHGLGVALSLSLSPLPRHPGPVSHLQRHQATPPAETGSPPQRRPDHLPGVLRLPVRVTNPGRGPAGLAGLAGDPSCSRPWSGSRGLAARPPESCALSPGACRAWALGSGPGL